MYRSTSSSAALLFSTVALALSVAPPPVRASGLASIRLTTERDILLADGKSTTTITAEVRNDRGGVVPDGTTVRFTATSGHLETDSATTRNGVARVTLRAADLPGSALISANVDAGGLINAAPAQLVVSFGTDADVALAGNHWAHIDGKDYVGYAVDFAVVQAVGKNGGAKLTFRGLDLRADSFQVHVADNTIFAQGNVSVSRGGVRRAYGSLVWNLTTSEGQAERLEDGKPVPVAVRGPRLDEMPSPTSFEADTFAFKDISSASLTVKTRSIALEPNARLQFRRAEFYLDGSRIATLPFHIMTLGQESLFTEQVIGFGADGVSIDFPLYYDVRPAAIGTLHVRRGARVGSSAYSTRPGWSLDLEQAYNGPQSTDGTIEITGLVRGDWGARWSHSQRFGSDTRGQVYVDFPNHSDLFANTHVSRAFRGFMLSATGAASRSAFGSQGAGGDWRAQVYAETNARPVGTPRLKYTLNLSTARQGFYGPRAVPGYHSHRAGIRLYTPQLVIARKTTLTQSLTVGQTWTSGGSETVAARDGLAVYASTALSHRLGTLGSATLSYDLTQTPERLLTRSSGRHRVGASMFLSSGTRWNLALTGSKSLDQSFSTLYGTLRFSLGGPWAARVALSASRFSAYQYQDLEYALIRRVGSRDLAVYYSTTSRRFQFDMTGARF